MMAGGVLPAPMMCGGCCPAATNARAGIEPFGRGSADAGPALPLPHDDDVPEAHRQGMEAAHQGAPEPPREAAPEGPGEREAPRRPAGRPEPEPTGERLHLPKAP